MLKLGTMNYVEALELQDRLVKAHYEGKVGDLLILLEHPHTYTIGRGGKDAHILFDEKLLARIGASFHRVGRGGDITYHGPGQIVGYPIVDLRRWQPDVHKYLRSLEQVLIRTLRDFGISAVRDSHATGVWVGDEKVAAIGVRVSRWITSHGFALNVNADLSYFSHIVPCGLVGKGVTSMDKLLGARVDPQLVAQQLVEHFSSEFRTHLVESSLADIEQAIAEAGERSVTSSDALMSPCQK